MKSDAPGSAARRGNDVHVEGAIVLAGEGDPLAVGREMRAALDARAGREANRLATLAADCPKVIAKNKANLTAAQGGLAQQKRLIGLRETRARDQKCSQAEECALHLKVSFADGPGAKQARARMVPISLRRCWALSGEQHSSTRRQRRQRRLRRQRSSRRSVVCMRKPRERMTEQGK